MASMKLYDLSLHACTDTAQNLGKLLLAYGHNNDALQALQDGVDGCYRMADDTCSSFGHSVVEKGLKNNLMADYRAGLGMFAKGPKPPTPDMLQELRDTISELTARIDGFERGLGLRLDDTPPSHLKLKL
jgi:hypothetical protein